MIVKMFCASKKGDVKMRRKVIEVLVISSVVIVFGLSLVKAEVANQTWIILDVKTCPYNTSEYVRGVFDCSNMAKMLYDWLTLKGHHCVIVGVENYSYGIRHAFLFVDGYAVEPTTKDWAWWYYHRWFEIDKIVYLDGRRLWGKEWEYPRRWR